MPTLGRTGREEPETMLPRRNYTAACLTRDYDHDRVFVFEGSVEEAIFGF